MNGRPRLSLRARLLTALLAVSTIFLLVLGLVAALAFGKRIGNVFDAQLQVAARRPIVTMLGTTDSYVAYYSYRTRRAAPISASSPVASRLAAYLDQRITARPARRLAAPPGTPFTVNLAGGPSLRAVWRLARPTAEANQNVVPLGRAIVVVARPLSLREAPLRQVIIAEIITGAVLIGLLALFGPWIIRRGLAPLDRMATTADQITSRGDLTARMPDSGDRAETAG